MSSLTLPILVPLFKKELCPKLGITCKGETIVDTPQKIEVFMQHMNPLYALKYSKMIESQGYTWNGLTKQLQLSRRLETGMLYLSVAHEVDEAKKIAKGFTPMSFNSFEELLEVWRQYSISSAVLSTMTRYAFGKWRNETRRRIHNISFIGNTFIYDFDSGTPSMKDFCNTYQGRGFDFVAVKSKSDHKYEHDRFKVLVRTSLFFTHKNSDEAPEGFIQKNISEYEACYIGFAKQMDFWQYADQSTKDLGRLCSNVSANGEAKTCLTLAS